jgi:hypothetical protein
VAKATLPAGSGRHQTTHVDDGAAPLGRRREEEEREGAARGHRRVAAADSRKPARRTHKHTGKKKHVPGNRRIADTVGALAEGRQNCGRNPSRRYLQATGRDGTEDARRGGLREGLVMFLSNGNCG